MEYDIEYEPGDDLCLIRVTGQIKRPDDSVKLQALCFEHAAVNECDKYLFDMRDTTMIGSIEGAYTAGVSPSTKGMDPANIRAALVYPELEPAHRVMQLVLNENGFNVHVFDDMESARHWLSL